MEQSGKKKGTIVCAAIVLMLLFFLVCSAAGCASASKAVYEQVGGADMAYGGKAAPATAPAPAVPPAPDAPARAMDADMAIMEEAGIGREAAYATVQEAPAGAPGQRQIIQNAYLHLEIRHIDEIVTTLQTMADQAGGYVASREIYNLGEERRAGHVSLRVPADRFALLLAAIKDLGKTKNERVFTDDVTMQYIDLEARITNLAAQEKRLRELLQKAESIEDIMHVERELGRIRGDLEAMEGNFRYLRERVQYSSIEIQLEEKDPRTLMVDDKFAGFGERLVDLLALNTNRLLKGFSGFFLFTLGSLPIVLPLLIIAFLIGKLLKAIRAKNIRKEEQRNLPQ
ncbi:MAG: DUF4349 domain-containing protein [Bacillota bacterium]